MPLFLIVHLEVPTTIFPDIERLSFVMDFYHAVVVALSAPTRPSSDDVDRLSAYKGSHEVFEA